MHIVESAREASASVLGTCRVLLVCALTVWGCKAPQQSAARAPVAAAPISNTDLCATRLHDICGSLLLYYATYRHLPASLEDLRNVPGGDQLQFVCPVSQQPYNYEPDGRISPQRDSLVVLFDPAPTHAGMRWAVAILEPQDSRALVTKVIALPESYFMRLPPDQR